DQNAGGAGQPAGARPALRRTARRIVPDSRSRLRLPRPAAERAAPPPPRSRQRYRRPHGVLTPLFAVPVIQAGIFPRGEAPELRLSIGHSRPRNGVASLAYGLKRHHGEFFGIRIVADFRRLHGADREIFQFGIGG